MEDDAGSWPCALGVVDSLLCVAGGALSFTVQEPTRIAGFASVGSDVLMRAGCGQDESEDEG